MLKRYQHVLVRMSSDLNQYPVTFYVVFQNYIQSALVRFPRQKDTTESVSRCKSGTSDSCDTLCVKPVKPVFAFIFILQCLSHTYDIDVCWYKKHQADVDSLCGRIMVGKIQISGSQTDWQTVLTEKP